MREMPPKINLPKRQIKREKPPTAKDILKRLGEKQERVYPFNLETLATLRRSGWKDGDTRTFHGNCVEIRDNVSTFECKRDSKHIYHTPVLFKDDIPGIELLRENRSLVFKLRLSLNDNSCYLVAILEDVGDVVKENKPLTWKEKYSLYLKSSEWENKRKKVLERDSYLCQACLENKATQVHHLDYTLTGDEPLFHLVSVCDTCHESITYRSRINREKQFNEKIIWWNS